MSAYAEIEISRFPIILVTFTGAQASRENFQIYLNQIEATYELGERLAIIFEATHAVLPKLQFQNMQAQWLRNNSEMIQSKCAGTAYVITKPVIRTMLKLIFALQEQPAPYVVAKNLPDAEQWVNLQLAAHPK
jgi:hypothetical protein